MKRARAAEGETGGARDGRLAVEGLVKIFGRKEAVKDVSFSMRVGEVVGLLGPNGAGKTTIFYMIVGFIKPNRGKIYLNGHSISGLPMYKRARLGISYLPQEPSVFRKLTVEQNIAAILETRKDLRHLEKKEKLDSLLGTQNDFIEAVIVQVRIVSHNRDPLPDVDFPSVFAAKSGHNISRNRILRHQSGIRIQG